MLSNCYMMSVTSVTAAVAIMLGNGLTTEIINVFNKGHPLLYHHCNEAGIL